VLATRRIGAIGYFSALDVFDYANGLTEPAVARSFAGLRRHFTDPNDPGLAAIWRQRRPTHLLEDVDVMAQIAAAAGGTPAGFVVQGDTFRVVRAFRLGADGEWLLAARLDQPPLPP